MKYAHHCRLVLISLFLLLSATGCNAPENSQPNYFLSGTDWRQGGYALVIVDKEGKASLVAQQDILQAHEQVLRAEPHVWLNMLPGEGGDQRKLYLFQHRRLIKSMQARIYRDFDAGSLPEHAQPLVSKSTYGEPKAPYLARLTRLQAQENVWVYQQSEVQPFQYFFHIDLPSVAVFHGSNEDNAIDHQPYEYVLGQQLYTQIKADLEQQFDAAGFDMSNVNRNLWSSTATAPNLYRLDNHSDGLLRDGNRMPLTADGWTLYHYRITVFGTPESHRQLQHYDFRRYLAAYRNNNTQLQSTLAQQASRAAPPTTPDQIIIDDYRETARIGQLNEQQYGLSYFELP